MQFILGALAMKQIDRAVVASDGHQYAKMVFPVADDPHVGSESMWVEVIGDGTFRLKNIPGWTSGVALDDVVAGRQHQGLLTFASTVAGAGHSTYRLAFQSEQPDRERAQAPGPLRVLGCGFERLRSCDGIT